MLKVDLHLHTAEDPVDRRSHSAFDLVGRAAELGFDALAITLHHNQLADPRLTAYARERGMTLIPGTERTIQGRHVLLLNFPAAAAESVRTFDEIERLKARTGGLVIAPHPFFPAPTCLHGRLDAHPDLFDAVEWSYFWTRGLNFNARAARWWGNPIRTTGVSSDAPARRSQRPQRKYSNAFLNFVNFVVFVPPPSAVLGSGTCPYPATSGNLTRGPAV